MELKFKSFTTEKGTYPTTFYYFNLMDCLPNNARALYDLIDHSETDDYEDDDTQLEIRIPNRLALYDLIKDLSNAISEEIYTYAQEETPTAPLDDATCDIHMAIDMLSELKAFDEF